MAIIAKLNPYWLNVAIDEELAFPAPAFGNPSKDVTESSPVLSLLYSALPPNWDGSKSPNCEASKFSGSSP